MSKGQCMPPYDSSELLRVQPRDAIRSPFRVKHINDSVFMVRKRQ